MLHRYEQNALFFNSNFFEATSLAGVFAYRGDLVVVEGEVGDAQGRRKPPTEVIRQAVLLADADKLTFFSGVLDDVAVLPTVVEKFQADFSAATVAVLFVVNIPATIRLPVGEASLTLIPLQDGMVWNALSELAGLEKGDFKGLSAADKVEKVRAEVATSLPRCAEATLADIVASRTGARREARGAV